MSNKPKKRSQGKYLSPFWMPATLFTVAMLVAYQGAHYATAQYAMYASGGWAFDKHMIGGEPAPSWVEQFFWPATRIDELLGIQP
jgi:hypothetical protein